LGLAPGPVQRLGHPLPVESVRNPAAVRIAEGATGGQPLIGRADPFEE
jgi:hypothetical protein